MKSYTDIEQSKKLAEILPLESADMCYKCLGEDPYDIVMRPYTDWKEEYKGLLIRGDANVIPCWSLAALFDILPDTITINDGIAFKLNAKKSIIEYYNPSLYLIYKSVKADNPIDACVAMIEKLHKLNLL